MIPLLIAAAFALQDKTATVFPVELKKPATTYWCWLPAQHTAERSWPAVVLLHGAGDTAENFIKAWTTMAQKHQFILVAAKSRDAGWNEADGDIVMAALEDAKKKYQIDPDRVSLLGYSSGAHMATMWGFKNFAPFRAICLLAGGFSPPGGKEYKAASTRATVLVCCGDSDPNLAGCKEVFERVKKDGFDAESNWVAGMGHSPPKIEVYDWFFDKLGGRLDAPAERLKRGKKSATAKKWEEAIAEYQAIAEDPKDPKITKAAETELAKIDKAGNDKLAEGIKKLEAGDKPGAKKALEEAARYVGLECARKARDEIEKLK